ncbi:mitochondrial carrier-like protein 2 [Plakobranchus ocellatus]|uniref:Mitochondrial carrier-like protein 2 n=1 Tax=Plakobranchus ocellatus TaxID=259542 RepID=A0AAV4DE39_9GAST|nr:mitochondrial carrier-like protein 2 [Plakobranchus ocellatus]
MKVRTCQVWTVGKMRKNFPTVALQPLLRPANRPANCGTIPENECLSRSPAFVINVPEFSFVSGQKLIPIFAFLMYTALPQIKDLKSYTGAACGLVVAHFTYPFTLVTNVMAVSGSRLRAGQQPMMPAYKGWTDCFSSLSREGDLKRGASAFWRLYKPRPLQLVARNLSKQRDL